MNQRMSTSTIGASPASTDQKNISCQHLLTQQPKCHGWLRRKSKLQQVCSKFEGKMKLGRSHSVVSRLQWQQRYAILHNGLMYVFSDETARQAQKLLHLADYDGLSDADEERTKDVLWPFKLEPREQSDPQQQRLNVQYFTATSEEELKKWQRALEAEFKATRFNLKSPRNAGDGCEDVGDSSERLGVRPLPAVPASKTAAPQIKEEEFDDTYELATEPSELSVVDAAMWSGSAEEARQVMGEITEDGVFLIRKSIDTTGYTLVVVIAGKPCKFRMTEDEEMKKIAFLDRVKFDSLSAMIQFYSQNNLPNKTAKLTKPYSMCDNGDSIEYE